MTSISRRSFILMTLALAACKRGADDITLTGQTMGTNYTVVAVDPDKSLTKEKLLEAIESSLSQTDKQMSNWNPQSEISQINASRSTDPIEISPEMDYLLRAAQEVHMASDGQFDLTVGPLIELWGFGKKGADSEIPSDAEIAATLDLIGQTSSVKLDGGKLLKLKPEAEMYLAAIGKGFGVDQLGATLESFGITNYMVEIGGDLLAKGNNPDGVPWNIAIETPDSSKVEIMSVVRISDYGMATSGDYRNYFEEDGVRYSHIIDSKTGRPVAHTTASVTVLTDNAMMADAWATALLVVGRERGLEIAEEQGLAAYFIERDTSQEELSFISTPSAGFIALKSS